jgi:glycosyltransferase involved in cell wall biosynthesis
MKSQNPMVSIVIPVFNGARYLEEAVRSIQKSTYKNFEVILVDDGSTKDNSKALIKRLSKEFDNVRGFSFGKNKGMDYALNHGIKKANGHYIARINQDDLMRPNRLATQVKFLQNHPEVVAVGSFIQLFTKDGNFRVLKFLKTDREIKSIWMMLSPFSDPTVMYRKEDLFKVGGYEQRFWPADDVHMWYKLGQIGELANIQQILMDIRWHEGAGSLRFFRLDTKRTYNLHRWAHANVEKATVAAQLFWIGQLLCGLILPPSFNWKVYRGIKSIVDVFVAIRRHSPLVFFPRIAVPKTA